MHRADSHSRRAPRRARMPISKDGREIVCRSILGTLPIRVCSRFDPFDVPQPVSPPLLARQHVDVEVVGLTPSEDPMAVLMHGTISRKYLCFQAGVPSCHPLPQHEVDLRVYHALPRGVDGRVRISIDDMECHGTRSLC